MTLLLAIAITLLTVVVGVVTIAYLASERRRNDNTLTSPTGWTDQKKEKAHEKIKSHSDDAAAAALNAVLNRRRGAPGDSDDRPHYD